MSANSVYRPATGVARRTRRSPSALAPLRSRIHRCCQCGVCRRMSRWQNHIQHRGPRRVISPRTVRLIMLTTAGGAVFPPISGFGASKPLTDAMTSRINGLTNHRFGMITHGSSLPHRQGLRSFIETQISAPATAANFAVGTSWSTQAPIYRQCGYWLQGTESRQ